MSQVPSFESDYNNGAHPLVLQHLVATNTEQSASYGFDTWSELARQKIRLACHCPEAEIFFLVGGTQANATVIDAMLPSYAAVIAAETAHINVHESGAIEASGHKVVTMPSHDGRIDARELDAYLKVFYADETWPHMAVPKMVYITFPTELGTLYQAHDIADIFDVCRNYDMTLYIDGARLGYGLASPACDFDMPWLARHCDVFYIGGTKVGALCGEAVVFPRHNAPDNFFTTVKRHGALLAKSRLAGVQFNALFTDDLYLKIAKHAIDKAMQLRQLFIDAGISIKDSPTNQQFVVLTSEQRQRLQQHVLFETWQPLTDDTALYRFVTSWATSDIDMTALTKAINCL